MKDFVLLLPLLHFYGLASIFPVGLALDAGCCHKKTVGGLQYNLVAEYDTTSHHCLSNCVYIKKNEPGQHFCFKSGRLAVSCMAADMVEKTEAVKGMKEKWEEIEREAMAKGKEQLLNPLNMTNMENMMMVINELDGHMEEMKGFMTMDTYIKGGDLEAAISTQKPKLSSPSPGTTSATSNKTEEELQELLLQTKVILSSMENDMAKKNYTGSCCRWSSVAGRNFTFIGEEEGALTAGCSSNCVYALPDDMTRKFCDLGGDCPGSVISTETPDFVLPQFAWVDSSSIMVTYQNTTLDVIHLTPMEDSLEEACLYDGALEVETTAFVTFRGCFNKSADAQWDIMLVSSHLPSMRNNFIWWANGTVSEPVMLPSNCDSPEDCVEDVFNPPEERQAGPRLASDAPIPTHVGLDFELMYDNSMVRQYGNNEAAYITYLIAWQGCALLRSRSITPRVICGFNWPSHYTKEVDGTNIFEDSSHYTVGSRPRHIITVNNNKDTTSGRAIVGLSCPTASWDISVTEHWGNGRDIAQTVRTFAHEIGHWLGMEHDFHRSNGGDNGPCNNQGIMSYGNSRPNDWSTCSNSNWQAEYRSTQHRCRADVSSRYSGGRSDYVATIEPQANTRWGPWGEIAWCNRDTFVHAAIATIEGTQGGGDDTALNRLYLACGSRSRQWLQGISSSYAPWGNFRHPWDNCGNGDFMNRLQLRSERFQGGGDDTSVNGFEAWCGSSSHVGRHNDGYWGDWLRSATCPGNSVFCGLQTRVEPGQGGGDDTALNGVRFACCYYRPCATFYEHGGYNGKSFAISEGKTFSMFTQIDFNDKTSSIRVKPGCRVQYWEHDNAGGKTGTATQDTSWIGNNWNDQISSASCAC